MGWGKESKQKGKSGKGPAWQEEVEEGVRRAPWERGKIEPNCGKQARVVLGGEGKQIVRRGLNRSSNPSQLLERLLRSHPRGPGCRLLEGGRSQKRKGRDPGGRAKPNVLAALESWE